MNSAFKAYYQLESKQALHTEPILSDIHIQPFHIRALWENAYDSNSIAMPCLASIYAPPLSSKAL